MFSALLEACLPASYQSGFHAPPHIDRDSHLDHDCSSATSIGKNNASHTVFSQELQLLEVHLFAVAPLPSISWPLFAIQTIRALVPAMLVNATLV